MPFHVAVVGAGFSGTMVAVHLSRLSAAGGHDLRVTIYEQSGRPGRGHAYSTTCPVHLLNVRASGMSAFADDAGHFLRWARERDDSVSGDAFLQRSLYGDYLSGIVAREIETSGERIETVREEVASVEVVGGGPRVALASGAVRARSHVVLAMGHPLPAPPVPLAPAVAEGGRYRENPWDPAALDGLPPDASILVIGSGLTAVDVILDARRRGIRGPIHLVSRRGMLPLAHTAVPAPPRDSPRDLPRGRVRTLMSALRREIARASARDEDWRPVFDALRPITQDLWRALPMTEKRRFLRHARPYWDLHRHRVAPEVGAAIRRELESGALVRHAARIVAIEADRAGLGVTIRSRGGEARRTLVVERAINCTGPNTGIEMIGSPVTRSLLRSGDGRPDELGIGLACDPDGALLDSRGRISDRLFTLGPLRKGELWESTAVPEIRVQAQRLAERILR